MFTRCYPAQGLTVLKEYIRQGGREQVILAYLTFESYGYFVGEKQVDPFLFEALEKITEKGWESDIICRLALLKKYASENNWDPKRLETAEKILQECAAQRLKFAFFRNLPRELLQFCQMEDKVFVQCKAGPEAKVTLHYFVEDVQGRSEEKVEPVKERYQGIYNKEFVLFYGELLHYYFVIERKGKTTRTEEAVLAVEDGETSGRSKYQMLNAMLKMKEQGREKELEVMTAEYVKREYQVSALFALMD